MGFEPTPRARARGGGREGERVRGDPRHPRASEPEGGAGHHRRHRHQSDYRGGHHPRRWRLRSGAQGQPADPLCREVVRYFDDPAATDLQSTTVRDKDHGRIETRTYWVSHDVAWMMSDRRYPGEHRFPALRSLVKTTTKTEWRGKITEETRYFISSA